MEKKIAQGKVYFEYFSWHLFSHGILEAKEGEEARRCFNQRITISLENGNVHRGGVTVFFARFDLMSVSLRGLQR